MSSLTIYILLFFSVFSIRVPFFYNSTVLAFIILSFLLLFLNTRKLVVNFGIFKSKVFILLFPLYLLLFLFCFIFPYYHDTNDYSKHWALLSQVFSIITIYLLAKLANKKINDDLVYFSSKAIFVIYTIQAFFVLICFLFPSVNELMEIFRSPDGAQYDSFGRYEGVKRLSLSGGQYFTLSASWVMSFIITSFYFKENKTTPLLIITFLIAFLFAGVSAGRIVFLGLFFSIFFLAKVLFVRRVLVTILACFMMSIIFFYLFSSYTDNFNRYINFAFELYYNWKQHGNMSSESTDILKSMYFTIDLDTFLFGHGRYMQDNGLYYLNTDAGYLRMILFYGIFGLLLNIVIDLIKLYLISVYSGYRLNFVAFILGASLFLIHVKGETFNHIVSVQVILYWLLFCCYFYNKRGFVE